MATRTISNSGGNFNSTSTWVEGIVPTAADDVIATASSGNLTVNVISYCASINFTNYVNTLTLSSTLVVNGDITLIGSMTITGAGYVSISGVSNITSNGKSFINFTFNNTTTLTLIDDMSITGVLAFPNAFLTFTINNNNLYVYGNVSQANGSTVQGTTSIILAGTGYWNSNNTTNLVYNPIVINSTGTITIISQINVGGSLTWISGTVVTTGATLYINGTAISINLPSTITWSQLSIYGGTVTLLNNLYTTNLTVGVGGSPILNGFNIYIIGSLSVINNLACSGTTTLHLIGSGSWAANSSYFELKNNIIINTTSSIILTGDLNYSTGILTYITGAVTPPTTFNIWGASTLNTAGISWNNFNILGGIINLSSSLNVNNILYLGTYVSTTFTGSFGFNTNDLNIVAAGRTINFTSGITYNVNDYFSAIGTAGSKNNFISPSTSSYFNLALTGSQNVSYTNATNIDSSGGQTIFSLGSTLTNTINWSNYPSNFFLLFE